MKINEKKLVVLAVIVYKKLTAFSACSKAIFLCSRFFALLAGQELSVMVKKTVYRNNEGVR